jgi:pimeloyl-ACP methyl ester carboxylesterase
MTPTQETRQAIEIDIGGAAVRGEHWPGDANWIVLLHEPGADLDAWGSVPAALAADGYSMLNIDLPGHGLSDDPWEPHRVPELVHGLAAFATTHGSRKVFVIAAGGIAATALVVPRIDALVALTPAPLPVPPPDRTPPALILVGGADDEAAARANAFFRQTRGWAVVSSLGTNEQGTALFESSWSQHALEQTLAFLRDYRIAMSQTSNHNS